MSTETARTSARRAPGALAAVLLGLLSVCCLATATATAAPAHAAAGAAKPSPGEKIADALRESPVYVDPAYEQTVPPAQQRRLVRQIERTGLPLYVVLVPLVEGDPWNGKSRQLTGVVHDRMGLGDDEEAVFITTAETGGAWLDGREWPGEKHQAREAASAVGFQDEMREKSLGARVARAVEIVESGDGRAQYEEATADLGQESDAAAGGEGSGPLPLLLAASALLVVLGGGAWFLVRRRRAAAPTPFSSPSAVFAVARAADERGLRNRAQDEVVAFGEELSGTETGDAETDDNGTGDDGTGDEGAASADAAAVQRALDAYAAASTVLDAARGIPDLAGVLALVTEGRDALASARPSARSGRTGRKAPKPAAKQQHPLPVCFFHPLHGRAARRIRWRPLGRRESLRVAACEECAAAVRAHRAPEVLTDHHEGRDVPYFEVPPADSLWAATGYGSLGEETITERVVRGDFSRTAHR